MNAHLRAHSKQLNIKTAQLASRTAVFRRKGPSPQGTTVKPVSVSPMGNDTMDDNPAPAMDIDSPVPRSDPQDLVDSVETLERRTAMLAEDLDVWDDTDSGSDNEQGSAMGGDSDDEFESEEEGDNQGASDGRTSGRTLEFELRAAEAGSFYYIEFGYMKRTDKLITYSEIFPEHSRTQGYPCIQLFCYTRDHTRGIRGLAVCISRAGGHQLALHRPENCRKVVWVESKASRLLRQLMLLLHWKIQGIRSLSISRLQRTSF